MTSAVDELWALAQNGAQVDADRLARALQAAAGEGDALDYRTRLLIRDSLRALRGHWGEVRFHRWLNANATSREIERCCEPRHFDDDPDEIGFPSLARRVMDITKTETILEFFRALSRHVLRPTRLIVGGSVALMLAGLLTRHTEDIDVVNELPPELRNQHEALAELAARFGLQLAHFQSHYLPAGWERRIHAFGQFDRLDVHLVDAYDVTVSKLCSKRAKDLDDLRTLKPALDREVLKDRLTGEGASLLAEQRLRDAAVQNWYVLTGEQLPV